MNQPHNMPANAYPINNANYVKLAVTLAYFINQKNSWFGVTHV
jgi:hypothetical protein